MTNEDSRMISNTRERIVRLETKVEAMLETRGAMETARETAIEALQIARNANKQVAEITDNQRWLWRTLIGTILAAGIAAVVAAVSNLQGV